MVLLVEGKGAVQLAIEDTNWDGTTGCSCAVGPDSTEWKSMADLVNTHTPHNTRPNAA